MLDFTLTDKRISDLCAKNCFPAAQLCVMHHGKIVHEFTVGRPDPSQSWKCNNETRFDVASLSKLFAGSAFLALCEKGVFSLDELVCESFPQFTGMREIRASANALVANAGASDEIVGYSDAGKVTCPCKKGPYELRFTDTGMQLSCGGCGATYDFHAMSGAGAEMYLDISEIKLS